MLIKQLVDEDFSNYKKPSMFIGFPICSFKCEEDYGRQVCQNSALATSKGVEISVSDVVLRYMNNNLTSAIVCGGLEPFDSARDLVLLIKKLRQKTSDDIVIYTGYNKEEIKQYIDILGEYKNIIIKFGRYIPNQTPHYDEVLGVELASDNQYAEIISEVDNG